MPSKSANLTGTATFLSARVYMSITLGVVYIFQVTFFQFAGDLELEWLVVIQAVLRMEILDTADEHKLLLMLFSGKTGRYVVALRITIAGTTFV